MNKSVMSLNIIGFLALLLSVVAYFTGNDAGVFVAASFVIFAMAISKSLETE